MSSKKVNEKTLMPFGEYKDEYLGDVPARYLLWFYDQPWATKFLDLMEYIAERYEELEKEKEREHVS